MATCNTNVVYIDTNLDTRFALLVSDLDTVSDLKKSILSEHPLCFPQIGQIQIHGIKVKREGHFYHLVDSLPVRSAFTGSNKSWLVSVDASALRECDQNNQAATLGIANNSLIVCGDKAIGSPSKRVSTFGNFELLQSENKLVENEEVFVHSPCVSQHTGKGAVEKLDAGVKSSVENNELPGSAIEYEVDETNKGIMSACVVSEEGNCKTVSNVKTKRKSRKKKEDRVQDDTSKVNDGSGVGLGDCTAQQDIEVVAKPLENADKEVIKKIEVLKEHQHTDCNNNNTKSDIDTVVSMKEASEPVLTTNKKHKKRKRSLTIDSKVMFKVETAAQKDEAHKSDETHEERKESKDQFELKNEKYRDDVEYKHDKVTGDILDTVTPAKKKKKSKEKSAEKNLSTAKLINGFNADISSRHDLEDQQKIKNSNADQSAENFNDTDPPRSIVKGRKKKVKINSSNPRETPVLTTSWNVEGADHSSIQKGGHEEISQDGLFSKDISMSKTTIDNMEPVTDACEEGIQSTEKTTGNRGNYSNLSDIEIKAHPANVDGPMELTEDNDKNEACEIEEAGEGREVSPQNDPKPMLLQKFTPSNQDNSDAKIGELNVILKVVDANGTTESIKSEKEKRRKRKAKKSGGGPALREGIDPVDVFESKTVIMKSLGATNDDPTSGNTDTEDNPLNQTNACEEGIQSTEKTTGNYSNLSDIEIKAHPANMDGPMELTGDNDKNEACEIEEAGEGREVSPQNDPKPMLLQKSTPSNQDNPDAKIGELNVILEVVDANGTIESIKSEKEKRRKRKAKKSGGGPALREGIDPVDVSESKTVIMKSLGATNDDPTSGNTDTEDNPLYQTEGGKIQQEESNAERTCKRQRKKSNNKQTSNSKSMSNMLPKDQVLDSKNSSPSSDKETHAKSSVAVTKKSNSASTKSTNKSCKTNLEPVKDSVRLEPYDSRINSGSKDAVQHSIHSPGEKDDDNLEAPSQTLKVNADQHFSPLKQPDEANFSEDILVDKLNETEMKDIETMARNNMHQLEETNGQTPAKDLSSSQKLSANEELDVRIHPADMVPNAHRTGQDSKVSGRSDSAVIGENRKTRVNVSGKRMDLEKQRKHVPVSNSKMEGSIKMIQNKAGKASGNNVHGIVSKTLQKKSLLSGAIFKDDSSSSSEDEFDNSDASTRTPSDNPQFSDSSDGDSSSGSYGRRGLENGGRSPSKASLTGSKGMSIDDVLRSSSWFKKARITASQLQESQSQTPEVVPDSLAD